MNKTTKLILLVLGSLLFCYTAAKAYLLSITWDEAFSYTEYVRRGVAYPKKFESMSANNHLLLTWLDIQLVKLFGVSELILRLPALMAHLLFLIYSAKLLAHFQNKWLIISSFLIINLNPYLLDFFSLARGYGLSIGLMMASIYYLYAFQRELKNKFAIYSLLYAAFSVLANYVLLNYFLGLFAVIFILNMLKAINWENSRIDRTIFWKNIRIPGGIFLLLLLFVLPITFQLRAAGALYFGAENGFWEDTFHTIVDRWFYELDYNYWFQRLAKAFILCTLIGAIILVSIRFEKKQFNSHNSFLVSILGICLFCVISTIAQHFLLHTLYLIDRTALFFTVLFPIVLVFFINEFIKEKPLAAFISYFAAVCVTVHMILAFNLTYVLEWKWDANTKEMLSDLDELKQIPVEKGNISMNIPLLFESGINFYRGMNRLTWLNTVARSKKRELSDDYYYLSPKELAKIHSDSIEILKTYPVTNNVLARPKFKWSHPQICVQQEMTFEQEPNQQYFIDGSTEYGKTITYIVPDSVAAYKHGIIVFEVQAMATAEQKNDVRLIASFENEGGSYSSSGVSLLDYIEKEDEWVTALLTHVVPAKIKAGDKLLVYLWNPNGEEVYVKKMGFKWYRYDQ